MSMQNTNSSVSSINHIHSLSVKIVVVLAVLVLMPLHSLAEELSDPLLVGITGKGSYNWPAYVLQSRTKKKGHGLNIKFVQYWKVSEAVEALAAGSLDFLVAAPIEILIEQVENYEDIRIVAGESKRAPFLLVTSSDIISSQDLKGRYVGISGYYASVEMLMEEELSNADLNLFDDYKIRTIGGSRSKLRALQAGMISGAFMLSDIAYDIPAKSDLLLKVPKNGFPEFPFFVTAMNRCFGERHPDLAVELVRQVRDGIRWLNSPENREAALELLTDTHGLSKRVALRAYNDYIAGGMESQLFSEDGELDEKKIQQIVSRLKQFSKIPSYWNKLFDRRPLDEAMGRSVANGGLSANISRYCSQKGIEYGRKPSIDSAQ